MEPRSTAEHELSWLDWSISPRLSFDGRFLLFSEAAEGTGLNYAVCLRRTDGSPVVQLGEGAAQGLSPDGKSALAITYTPPQLLLYPTGTGEKRQLDRGNLEGYRSASWFPDGKRIFVCANESGKATRCYMQEADGGAPRALTPDGDRGVVSPDGHRVAVWRAEKTPVIYPINEGNPETIPSVSPEDMPIHWAPDGRSLIFFRPQQIPGQVERVDLVSGKRDIVRRFAPPDLAGVLRWGDVSASVDSGIYAYSYYRMLSQLYVVEGAR